MKNNSTASDGIGFFGLLAIVFITLKLIGKIEWIESIVDQCLAAKVPVFVKQLDLNGKCERDITKFPKHLQIRQVPWATKGEN